MQYRSGIRQIIRVPVASATVITPGDLVYLDSNNNVVPAADFPWTTDVGVTRAAFAERFLGVAYEASANGETELVGVDISPLAIYETDTVSDIPVIGMTLAPTEDVLALSNTVMEATGSGEAIARVLELRDGGDRIGVGFSSSIAAASANTNAVVG